MRAAVESMAALDRSIPQHDVAFRAARDQPPAVRRVRQHARVTAQSIQIASPVGRDT